MDELAQCLAGRQAGSGAVVGVRCEPRGQWIIDLGAGVVRGSAHSLEVDERGEVDLVIAGPEEALTEVLTGNPSPEYLAAITVEGDPNALEELLTLL
jgi:hypothetical protein